MRKTSLCTCVEPTTGEKPLGKLTHQGDLNSASIASLAANNKSVEK
jgi:hypothetical protein